MSPLIGIIVLNWNGSLDTIECLESLSKLDYPNFRVVVVDNASSDNSRLNLLQWGQSAPSSLHFAGVVAEQELASFNKELPAASWIYLQASQNGGFAAGNNLGIRLALQSDYEYVWLLNNDTVVEPLALTALVKQVESDSKIGMCGSLLRYYDDRTQIQAVGGAVYNLLLAKGKQLGQGLNCSNPEVYALANEQLSYIAGASMLMPKAFLLDVGLMEESYFLYFEEFDWARRASPRWKVATAPDSVVYHKEGATIGTASRGTRSHLSQYYLNRNLIRFYALHVTWLLPVAVLRVFYDAIKCFLKFDLPRAKITCQALVDGLLLRSGAKNFQ